MVLGVVDVWVVWLVGLGRHVFTYHRLLNQGQKSLLSNQVMILDPALPRAIPNTGELWPLTWCSSIA